MSERTHYVILGISERATAEEVRVAYLNLARALHPDRLVAAPAAERRLAERRMREVNAAHDVLRDRAKRTDYDRELRAERTRPAPGSRPAGSAAASAGRTAPERPRRPDDDELDFAGFRPRPGDDDIDDEELSPAVVFLLQRAPLIAVLVIAAFLFIATAYAAAPAPEVPGPSVTTTTICVPAEAC